MSPCQAITAALDGSFDAGLLLDIQGTVLYQNSAARKLFGTEQMDATRTHVSSFFITNQHGNGSTSSWEKVVNDIEPKISYHEGTGLKKNRMSFPVIVSLTKFENCRCCSNYASCAYIREKTDENTKEEQHRLVLAEAAVNAAYSPIFSINEAGTILMANKAAVKQFGWNHDEFIGSNISIIAGGDHGRKHDSYLSRYFKTGEKRVIGKKRELTARRKDGSEFPIELGITEVKSERGDRIFCGFVRDLTQRKLNEEKLKLEERLTKGMIDSAFDPMFQINDHGIIQIVNQAAVDQFGWTQEELLGGNISMIVGGGHQKNHDSYLAQYLRTGEKRVLGKMRELTARRKDGSEFPIQLGLTEVTTKRGERMFCGFVRDLSRQKLDEEKLKRKERLTKGMIDSAFDPMFQINDHGIIQIVNQAAVDQFGWTQEEFLGKNIRMIVGGIHQKNHNSYIARYLRTGEKRVLGKKRELTAVRKDGSEFFIQLGLTEVITHRDEQMFCGFVRDLSRQKLDEEKNFHKERLLKGMIDSAFDPMFQISKRGIIQIVNQAAVDQFGWTLEEFLGSNISMIVGGKHQKNHDRYLVRYLRTGEKRVIGKMRELTARRKDGSGFPIQLGLTEVTTDSGEKTFCGFVRDLTQRKLDEEEIKRVESLITGMIDSAFDPMFQINDHGIIQIVNQAAVHQFGWSRKEFLGSNISMIVGGGHQKNHDSYLAQYLETGEKRVLGKMRELIARRKDGSEFPIQLGLTEVTTKRGERMFCGFVRDLSRRKLNEEKLKRKEKLTKGMIDSAFDPMIEINECGIIRVVNQAAVDQFGWTQEEFLGRNISMIVGGGHQKNHNSYLARYLETGEKRVLGKKRELTAVRKDGSEFPIQLGLTEVITDQGERMFCGLVRDLSRQKLDEEKLKRKERLTKGMIDSAFDPMFQINHKGIIQIVNQAAVDQFGWSREEFLGGNIRMIVGGGHQKNHDSYLAQYLETGEKRVLGKKRELTARRKDGSEFPIQLGLTEVVTKCGERMFCGFVRDLSQLKLDAERIRRKESMNRGMIDSSFDPMFQINECGTIQMINQASVDKFGWSRDELLGSNISMIVGGGHRKSHTQYIRRYLETGENHVMGKKRELTAVRKDGSEFLVELGVSEVITVWGEHMFCGFVRDITQKKFVERDLEERQMLTSGILETLSDSLFIIDENGMVYLANSAAGKIFDLSKDELIGKNFSMILAPEQADKFAKYMKSYARPGRKKLPPKKIELEAQGKNGRKFLILLNMVGIHGPFPILLSSFSEKSTHLISASAHILPDRKNSNLRKSLPQTLLRPWADSLHGTGSSHGSWLAFGGNGLQSEAAGCNEEENV